MLKIKLKIRHSSLTFLRSMSIQTQIQNMNEFIRTFLNRMVEDDVQDMIEEWDAPEVQEKLKKLLKKRKKKKDPNKPKRPKSSYIFFCKRMRSIVKEDLDKDCKTTDITSELGRRWNKLKESNSKRDKKMLAGFVKEAIADKERYEEEMKDYVPVSYTHLRAHETREDRGFRGVR